MSDQERFDRIARIATSILGGLAFAILMRVAAGEHWLVALATGVTGGVLFYLIVPLTGQPSAFMGEPREDQPLTMPPTRNILILAGGVASSVAATLTSGTVRGLFTIATIAAAAILVAFARQRR